MPDPRVRIENFEVAGCLGRGGRSTVWKARQLSLDRMVATSYGTLAVQQLQRGHTGVMVALQNGVYTTVPMQTAIQGTKRVDVDQLYDVDQYRPKVGHLLGKPMFLY